MRKIEITQKEYNEVHALTAERRSIKEMLNALTLQLAKVNLREDKWWKDASEKYNFDLQSKSIGVDYKDQTINVGQVADEPKEQAQATLRKGEEVIKKRERPPELNGLISPEEIKAMQEANNNIK